LDIQNSLQELKNAINMWDSWNKIFWVDNIMKIIFNNNWNLRNKLWFEANKLKSIMYMMISDEWKGNLDLLYNELEKSKSESELKENLWIELSNLESEVKNNNTSTDQDWDNQSWNENENENKDVDGSENKDKDENINTDENWNNNTSSENIHESSDTQIESLNNNENYIYSQAKLYWITDNRQIAYILATVKWECGFKNIKEIWWENKKYGKEWFYGRGYVQLTHKLNYKKFTDIIKKSGLNFKDNDWKVIVWKDVDLVKNPDLILQSNDLAAFILVYGMKNWSFTWKSLDDYINNKKCDFKNSRRIINWTDKANQFAENANNYLSKLWWENNNEKKENIDDNILVWPELLASNRDEIWWLWNSIMYWIQWLKWKSQFKKFGWIEWKSTITHPDKFNSKNDVKKYIQNNKWIKSFMFYFGWNTSNNKQTLSDIRQWSQWFQEEWIQPVLCTCIWVDSHITSNGEKWLKSLNNDILSLWKEEKYPVIDFAKIDNNIPKWNDNIHPTWSGYQKMREEIDKCLA
jgi:hypothetical protein